MTTDIVHPQNSPNPTAIDPLLLMILGSVVTQMIAVAAQLGLADLLAGGPRSVDDLAVATQTHPPSLYRLLRALAGVGIFAETRPRHFDLTPLASRLQTNAPLSLKDFAILFSSELHLRTFHHLLYSVQTGQAAFEKAFGLSLFEHVQQHPGDAAIFNQAMTSVSRQEARAVRDAYDFSGFHTLVDVGGGHGLLLSTLLQAQPGLKGILFDHPAVVAGAQALLKAEGVADRCQVVGGDFFAGVPAGGDGYMLKYIVHDWDDERALKILRNCRAVMAPGHTLLVIDAVIPAGNTLSLGKLRDIIMLAMSPGGLERTEAEFQGLLAQAGFKLTKIIPTKSLVSIVEGVPE